MDFLYFLFQEVFSLEKIVGFLFTTMMLYFLLTRLGAGNPKILFEEIRNLGKFKLGIALSGLISVLIFAYIQHLFLNPIVFDASSIITIALIQFILCSPALIFLESENPRGKVILIALVFCIGIFSTYLGGVSSYNQIVKNRRFTESVKPSFLLVNLIHPNSLWLSNSKDSDWFSSKICDNLRLGGINCDEKVRIASELGLNITSRSQAEKVQRDLNAHYLLAVRESKSNYKTTPKESFHRYLATSSAYAAALTPSDSILYDAFIIPEKNRLFSLPTDSVKQNFKSDSDIIHTTTEITFTTENRDLLISYFTNFSKGIINYETGVFREAVISFRKILKLIAQNVISNEHIDGSQILNYLGASYFRLDNLSKSIEALTAAKDQNPANVFAHVFLARAKYKLNGDLEAAIGHLETAHQIDSTYYYAYYSQGIIYSKENDYKKSNDAYNMTLDLEPSFLKAKHNLAVNYIKMQRPSLLEKAEKLLTEIIEIDNKYALAYYNLGCVYAKQLKLEQALQIFENNRELLAKKLTTHGNEAPLEFAKTDPDFDVIRNDSKLNKRFEKILQTPLGTSMSVSK